MSHQSVKQNHPVCVDLSDIFRARRRIAGHVRRTPLVRSRWLSAVTGGRVYLKLESLQETNSFKLRGAMNAALALIERTPDRSAWPRLVTASAGNAGRAFSYAAERLGLHVVVFTPRDAPRTKLDAIRSHGAELRSVAASYEEAEALAKQAAESGEMKYLSPYSHPDVIAGAGTIGVEILEDIPDVDTVLVPVGGGGLIAGISSAVKAIAPGTEVIGVEAAASPAFSTSLRAGKIVEVPVGPTIADGLAGNMDPENLAFPIVQQFVDRVVLCEDDALVGGIVGLAAEEHLIAEGAGIAGVAALLAGHLDVTGRSVAVVVSGSNIDIGKLARLLGGGAGRSRTED
jgi:threonine dehydratase